MAALQPGPAERLSEVVTRRRRGGRRARRLRRFVAVLLMVTAGALAVVREPPAQLGTTLLAAAHDLPVGAVLTGDDLRQVTMTQVPDGALTDSAAVDGRTVAGPVRRGEVLTDARLVPMDGPDPGPGRVAVPIRPADPATADLLNPGVHVTLLGAGGDGPPVVLSNDAVVLAVQQVGTDVAGGRLVVVAVRGSEADRLTAASLDGGIALRFS